VATCPTLVTPDIELVGAGVLLRPLTPADAELLYQAARESIAEMSHWLPWCHQDYSFDDACSFLSSRAQAWADNIEYVFGVFERSSGRFVGGAGVNFIDWTQKRANLGYWTRSTAVHHGYASQAARLLARWALTTLHLHRIEIVAAVGNIPSQATAARAGASREGVLRNRYLVRQIAYDAVMFSFIPSDFSNDPSQVEGQ